MLKWILIIWIVYGTGICLPAQDIIVTDQKTESQYKKARAYQRKGQPVKAERLFNKILDRDPYHVPSCLGLAGIYFSSKDFTKAEEMLEKAVSLDPDYDPEMYFSLALVKEKKQKLLEASRLYRKFAARADANPQKREKALDAAEQLEFIQQAYDHPVPFDPVDPGPGINTRDQEYLATVDVTGERMVFSRRKGHQEDLYTSYKTSEGWAEAQAITSLNTAGNEAAHCLSQDGSTIIYTSCERRDSYGGCDLYMSRLEDGQWTVPVNLGAPVNSIAWESQPSLSADERTLYFTSNRPGGYGGRDIWISEMDLSGRWSQPENAGKNVNTKKNEEAPFLHADGKTLYFMSNGHPGMGGYDIYVSRRDTLGWSKPMNLGYPINSAFDEGALRVAADGYTAYFSSDRTDLGAGENQNLDIFSFTLPPEARAKQVGYVRGKVLDRETHLPVKAKFRLADNARGQEIRTGTSDINGNFLMALPPGVNYNFTVQESGYAFFSDNFRLDTNENTECHFDLLIELIPLKNREDSTGSFTVAEPIVLNNIFFETGSSELNIVESALELNTLVDFLESHPDIKIQIQGHTDNVGTAADNQQLSEARARAVYEHLTGAGIDPERLSYMGFGESQPVETNETEAGRRKNRRTTFIIINR